MRTILRDAAHEFALRELPSGPGVRLGRQARIAATAADHTARDHSQKPEAPAGESPSRPTQESKPLAMHGIRLYVKQRREPAFGGDGAH
ncbi:MAG: hypothetical protein JRG80_03120 [Deltaproteobacteria bacterium]|nr:hypothetical protein [Deltaproteobacteria bacterium]